MLLPIRLIGGKYFFLRQFTNKFAEVISPLRYCRRFWFSGIERAYSRSVAQNQTTQRNAIQYKRVRRTQWAQISTEQFAVCRLFCAHYPLQGRRIEICDNSLVLKWLLRFLSWIIAVYPLNYFALNLCEIERTKLWTANMNEGMNCYYAIITYSIVFVNF